MAGKLSAVIMQVLSALKTDIRDYCELETVDDNYSIVALDGSLVSIVRFNGKSSVLGRSEYAEFIKLLSKEFSVFFNNRGHQAQFIFYKDIESTEFLNQQVQAQRLTVRRLKLDLEDLIDESVEVNARYINLEESYIAFWSRPALLSGIELNLSTSERLNLKEEVNWKATSHAQNILRPISFLTDRHKTFVDTIINRLNSREFGCSADKLDVSESLREIKRKVYPDITGENWTPSIPHYDRNTGKAIPIPVRWKDNTADDDMSEIMHPPLPDQIMVSGAQIGKRGSDKSDVNSPLNDSTIVKVGDRYFAPLLLKLPPSDTKNLSFQKLFNDLNNSETRQNGRRCSLPFSFSCMIESDGMSVFQWKQIFTGILAITNTENKNINAARDALREMQRDSGQIVKIRFGAMTWTDGANIKELLLRKQKLWKAMETWGNSTVYDRSGNALESFQSNVLALTTNHLGTPAPAPLEEALALMPLSRPASPFSRMTTLCRSLDGKFMPWESFSDLQTTWLKLYSGRPGFGKSVAMNSYYLDACMMPGITNLPWLLLIDIGISSEGCVDAIRDGLPEDKKYLAMYRRLQNSSEYCINICDIHLGGRKPLPHIKAAIVNFITQLVTPIERAGKPYEGMTSFVTSLVEMVYTKKDTGEGGQPNLYSYGRQPDVDKALKRNGIDAISNETAYYDLVDRLFEKGEIHAAEMVQREAVPRLSDFQMLFNDSNIKNAYGDIKTENDNTLVAALKFGLLAAIDSYPMFNGSTQFDIGSSRIVSLDLQDVVVKGKSPSEMHRTSLMYMIAIQSFMKKIALSREDLKHIRQPYLRYYTKLINELIDHFKILGIDEYHNTGGGENITNLITTFARENRKWLMEMVIGSQSAEDFGALTEFASSMMFLDSGTEETRQYIRQKIGLSPVAESALVSHCTGPSSTGVTFLAYLSTKKGKHYQLFTQTMGARRLWRLNSTAKDRKLRTLLFDKMPKKDAIKLLSQKFPSGSAVDAIDRMMSMNTALETEFDDDEMIEQASERLASKLINEYLQQI
ncbi:type IV secretion protein DotO [Acerihabitans sp. TG2]|uniref:type IV secretion protein DotO n=1 Tax=Acerihabitans sp. TG2 TaxID=3096008 RepID=UPI002B23945E|nr:type IV secretion protein DotO [Acerihabitans sp. TG2]MEA9392215.1 type IV secretion protein DotO [Acerihabitans sp. TG2]